MPKDSTIFYQGQVDICRRHLDAEQFGRLMGALFDLAGGGDPEVGDDIALAFEFMALQQGIDREKYEERCRKNRENGKLGGRPKKGEENRKKANGFFKNPNDNDNENENDNENDNENENGNERVNAPAADAVAPSLVSLLNSKTGGTHKVTPELTARVGELLAAGYTEADMVNVINRKAAEWMGSDKMRAYLRPRTLFGEKFPEYVAAPETEAAVKEKKKAARKDRLREEREQKARALSEIMEDLARIRGKPGGIKANYDEYMAADDRRVALAQEVDNLDRQLSA